MAAYEAAFANQPGIASSRVKHGTFRALAVSYFGSVAFRTMKPSTQSVYRNAIERLCEQTDREGREYGDKSAATLQREHVVKLMAAKAEKPESANLLRKVLRAMMQHAVEIGLRADDPTRDVKAIRVKSDGFHSWTGEEIAQFENGIQWAHGGGWRSRSCSTPGSGAPTWCAWDASISTRTARSVCVSSRPEPS